MNGSSGSAPIYGSLSQFQTFNYVDPTATIGHDPFVAQMHGGLLHGTDPNSPEMFKQNIQVVAGQVGRVQALAQSALMGMSVL